MSNSKKQPKHTPGANAPGNDQAQAQTPQPPSDGEDHQQISFPKRAIAASNKRAANDNRAVIYDEPPENMEQDLFMAALGEMEVTADDWEAAKDEPEGAPMYRLAFKVMTHLRIQDPSDRRWAKHKKDPHGCCLRGENKPTCKCAALEYVMENLHDIVRT